MNKEERGKRLKLWREANGWTQEELARRLGCAGRSLNRWEQGKTEMTGVVKEALRKLGMHID